MSLATNRAGRPRYAATVAEWVDRALLGYPLPLAPGYHYVTEPIEITSEFGAVLRGPARCLMDPISWGRDWIYDKPDSRQICQIGFDDTDWPADTPAIKFTGCRNCLLEGVNLFRKLPGAMVYDTNATGKNSAGNVYRNLGFHTRFRQSGWSQPDPWTAITGVTDFGTITQSSVNREGYYGIVYEGTNGTDNFYCEDCDFHYLQYPYLCRSAQTTRVEFARCFFRWNDTTMRAEDSPNLGPEDASSCNVIFNNCSWYDNGPIEIEKAKSALSSIQVYGGWLDNSDDTARTFIDATDHTGILNITVSGMESKAVSSGSAPWLVLRDTFPEQTRLGRIDPMSVPDGQQFCSDSGLSIQTISLTPYVLERSGPPDVADPEFKRTFAGGIYHDTLNDKVYQIINNGGTLVGQELTSGALP